MRIRPHFVVHRHSGTGERIMPGARCHFVSPILGALGDAGSAVASVAAPAITGAALGAGVGALTRGNIGQAALLGGIGGGALGYMTSGSGTAGGTGLYNDTIGALGLGGGGDTGWVDTTGGDTGWTDTTGQPSSAGLQQMLDANGKLITTDGSGNPLYQGPTQSGAALGGGASGSSDTGWMDTSGQPSASGSLPSSTTGQAANVAGTGGGLFGGKPGGISNTALTLGLLSAAGSMFNKPQVGTWQTPTPASTAANAGPYFNQPLNTNVPGRTPTPPPANTDWYTYGQRPEQSFFSGNSLQNYGWAKGGALSHTFSTDNGEQFVSGPGTGTSDSVPARLSDGEYVLTNADVARIGHGDNARGAAILDHDRSALAHALGEKKFVRKPLKGERRAA